MLSVRFAARFAQFALAATLAAFAPGAAAVPITFIYTGTGSGTIGFGTPGATSFSNANFIITATGETSARYNQGASDTFTPGVSFIDHLTAEIDIAGLGEFQFVSPATRTFLNSNVGGTGQGLAGFTRGSVVGIETGDLFHGPRHLDLASWDMQSSIGPISGTGRILQWTSSHNTVLTSGGRLVMNNATPAATFEATLGVAAVIPEPETYGLFLAGLGLLGFAARKRGQTRFSLKGV